jgi:hypothetical protein
MSSAKALICALVTATMFHSATAAESGNWSVGVSGGTLGISPEIGYRFNKFGGLRANGGFFDYDRTEEIDDIDYDGTLKLNSVGVLADLYPFGGSFRISAGARSNDNRIDLVADEGTVEIGDETYTQAEYGTIRGRVDFKSLAPTVTLGWGGKLKSGFTIGFEAGVMMQGSPRMAGIRRRVPVQQQRFPRRARRRARPGRGGCRRLQALAGAAASFQISILTTGVTYRSGPNMMISHVRPARRRRVTPR